MPLVIPAAGTVEPVKEPDHAVVCAAGLVVIVVLMGHRAEPRRLVERHLVAAVMERDVEQGDDRPRVEEHHVRSEEERPGRDGAELKHGLDRVEVEALEGNRRCVLVVDLVYERVDGRVVQQKVAVIKVRLRAEREGGKGRKHRV